MDRSSLDDRYNEIAEAFNAAGDTPDSPGGWERVANLALDLLDDLLFPPPGFPYSVIEQKITVIPISLIRKDGRRR